MKDSKGQTPLHYCAFYNNVKAAKLLLANSALVNIEDNFGNQPLWTAVFNDKGFGNRVEIAKVFIGNGADKNHKNKAGRSPLDLARKAGYTDILSILDY